MTNIIITLQYLEQWRPGADQRMRFRKTSLSPPTYSKLCYQLGDPAVACDAISNSSGISRRESLKHQKWSWHQRLMVETLTHVKNIFRKIFPTTQTKEHYLHLFDHVPLPPTLTNGVIHESVMFLYRPSTVIAGARAGKYWLRNPLLSHQWNKFPVRIFFSWPLQDTFGNLNWLFVDV